MIFNKQLDFISLNIKMDISNKCNSANAYFDLKINNLIKKYGVTDKKKIKKDKIKNVISDIEIIEKLLKLRGYDKYGKIYTKGFVVVILNEGKELTWPCN